MQLARQQSLDLSNRLQSSQRRYASLVYRLLTNRLELRTLLESTAPGASSMLPPLRLYRVLRKPGGYMSIAELAPMSGGSEWPLASRLESVPGGAVLHVMGEVDLLTAPALREQLSRALEAHGKIVVDCSNLDYIDVAGIRILEETEQTYNARLAVIGSKPIVHKIFEVLQLQSVIPIFPNREAALNFLKGN